MQMGPGVGQRHDPLVLGAVSHRRTVASSAPPWSSRRRQPGQSSGGTGSRSRLGCPRSVRRTWRPVRCEDQVRFPPGSAGRASFSSGAAPQPSAHVGSSRRKTRPGRAVRSPAHDLPALRDRAATGLRDGLQSRSRPSRSVRSQTGSSSRACGCRARASRVCRQNSAVSRASSASSTTSPIELPRLVARAAARARVFSDTRTVVAMGPSVHCCTRRRIRLLRSLWLPVPGCARIAAPAAARRAARLANVFRVHAPKPLREALALRQRPGSKQAP